MDKPPSGSGWGITPEELRAELEKIRSGWGRKEWNRQSEHLRPPEYRSVKVRTVRTPSRFDSDEGPS